MLKNLVATSAVVVLLSTSACNSEEPGTDLRGGTAPSDFIHEVNNLERADGLLMNPSEAHISEVAEGSALTSASVKHLLGEDAQLPNNIPISTNDELTGLIQLYVYGVLEQSEEYPGDYKRDLINEWDEADLRSMNLGSEISFYRTWALAWSDQENEDAPDSITQTIESVDTAGLDHTPYLVLALRESQALLSGAPSENTHQAWKHVAELEYAEPQSEEEIQDLFAIIAAKKDHNIPVDLPENVSQFLVGIASNTTVDIQMRTYAAASLGTAGEQRAYENVLKSLHEDRSQVDGLYTDGTRGEVSRAVESTYLISELLVDEFDEVTSDSMIETLIGIVESADLDLVTRLQAAVTLDRAGAEPPSVVAELAENAKASFEDEIDEHTFDRYFVVSRLLKALDPNITLSTLQEFDTIDERSESHAMTAITYSYLFENQEEVKNMFEDVQQALPDIVRDEAAPFEQRVYAASALPASGLLEVDTELLDHADEVAASQRGCEHSKFMLKRAEGDQEVCDLDLTVRSLAIAPSN